MRHPERNEGSRLHGKEIPFGPAQGGLHSVQNDNVVDFATALAFYGGVRLKPFCGDG
jgi:hypothetical protein